jgi:hypothetical protein
MNADRSSIAGSRYLDLQRKARTTGKPTDELIQLYALECFLDRLTRSAFAAEKLVTTIARGTASTRWRDFVDLYSLAGRHSINSASLRSSLELINDRRKKTEERRKALLKPKIAALG